MDHDDPPALALLWLFHQPAQVVQVTGQQHDWSLQFERCSSHYGIDGATMTGPAGCPE
jgi:hypothetical protein